MSGPSRSAEGRRGRIARALGVVALLLLQGGCGTVLLELLQLERRTVTERPTRAAARREFERLGSSALLFPSAGGTVDSFANDEIVLMSITGHRVRVRIDRETFVTARDGPAGLAGLHPGTDVVVSGVAQPDGAVLADVLQVVGP